MYSSEQCANPGVGNLFKLIIFLWYLKSRIGDIVEENDPSKVRIPMYGTGNPATRKK